MSKEWGEGGEGGGVEDGGGGVGAGGGREGGGGEEGGVHVHPKVKGVRNFLAASAGRHCQK